MQIKNLLNLKIEVYYIKKINDFIFLHYLCYLFIFQLALL
jgi:hypothetical protein